MSDGEGTSFLQWREREQAEAKEGGARTQTLLLVAAAVVVLGILSGVIILLLS